MDNNDLNKKRKLKHMLAETIMEEGINNSTGTFGNIATVNGDVNQSNTSTVDVPNSGESSTSTEWTLCADGYGVFQLREFLGRDCPSQITTKSLDSFGSKQIGILKVCWNIATKERISAIKK